MRLGKAGCCVDETGQFHDAPHKVQIARMRVQGGEQINRNRASRFSCHVCAEFTGPQPAVFLRCGRSRSPSRSDGGDPAASSYGEREATQGKPLKNALKYIA